MHIHIEFEDGPLTLRAERLKAHLAAHGLAQSVTTITENGEPSAMAEKISAADILFACRKVDIAAAKRAAPGLAWVQVISAGVETLVPTLPDGVVLTNASGVHGDKGGEFVLTAALMLNYQIPRFASDKVAHAWEPTFGGTIDGKTAVLLGVGGIGVTAAAKLRAQGVRVIGVTRSGRSEAALDGCIAVGELDAVLPQADFLVSTLPLTKETEGLIDRRRLELLPEGAGVVVVGRAKVFDYEALADLLRSGHLGGAVLDVFPTEPLPKGDPLWDVPRLIMTPHCSVDDHGTYLDRCLDIFANNLSRRLKGEPMRNVVDRTHGY